MAEFKLNISDPKTGKTHQREVKEDNAKPFLGLKIGESIKGEAIDLTGYEFEVTGGSDHCGFPMRPGISGERKRILAHKGVGVKVKDHGILVRKTVCGDTVNDKITQVNLKVTKQGKTPLEAPTASAEGEAKAEEAPAKEAKAPKEEAKAEEKPTKEAKTEAKEEPAKEEAPAKAKAE